jgi:hypothetical protein
MMVNDMNNIDVAKSYKTEAMLSSKLTALGLANYTHMVVCNRQGRYTAIFYRGLTEFEGDVMKAARRGFKTVG